jgi:hypothetical protein
LCRHCANFQISSDSSSFSTVEYRFSNCLLVNVACTWL